MRHMYFGALAVAVALGTAGTRLSAQSTDTTVAPTSTTTTRTAGGDTVTTTTSQGTYVTSSAADTMHKTSVKFGIEGGTTIPVSETSNFYKEGWNAGAFLDVFSPSLPTGLRILGSYNEMPSKATDASKLKVAGGDLDLVFNVPVNGALRPYILAGVGAYSRDAGVGNDPFGTGSTWHFAANGGAGIRVDFSHFGAFVEGRYLNLFASGTDTKLVPVVIGLMFGSSPK